MSIAGKAPKSLDTLIQEAGGPVSLLRSSRLGPYLFPGIPPEFTNWRDEVRAWKDSVALLEQSYHMTELYLRGREVIPFLSQFALNKFDPFSVLRAKQVVLAGHDGYMIGDAILFREAEDFLRVVGAPLALDWLLFNAQSTSFDVTAEKNDNWSVSAAPRNVFRVQIQGPYALALMQDVTGGKLPEIRFFSIGEFQIAGKNVRALRHGMAGTPGFEIYGPWDDQQPVREALEMAGERYGLRKVGALAYANTAQESGWLPLPLPGIYHSAELKPYREWLNTHTLEAIGSLGGSFISDRIEDYYVDPIEVGYAGLIDWNREFVGRDALREKAATQRRKKVTLVWNDDDVAATLKASLFDRERPSRFVSLPSPMYSTWASDAVLKAGKHVGVSQYMSYSANAWHVISHGLIEVDHAEVGTELTLLWGEPNSRRPTVDRHEVREIRVIVAPTPYFDKVIKTGQQ